MITDTRQFLGELKAIQHSAAQAKPSKVKLAAAIEKLAGETWAASKKAPKKAPKKVPQEVLNAGEIEKKALETLRANLEDAVQALDAEISGFAERLKEYKEEGYEEGQALRIALHVVDLSEIQRSVEAGLDRLAFALEQIEDITEEHALVKAVLAFSKTVEKNKGIFREEEGNLEKARTLLAKAEKSVPKALTGPGSLAQLQACLDNIAEFYSVVTTTSCTAPKVPNALEPADPRQQQFNFTAGSFRSPVQLQTALQQLQQVAAKPYPSRETLASALCLIAAGLGSDR